MAAHCHGGNAILPIRFFKSILKTNLQRLKIPNKFAMRYGDGLPNPVFMKPPDGTQWEVYWAKESGEVWFGKGWKEFVEHYSLDQGHLVFFKYEGTSQIDVLIHDQGALEIDYASCEENDKHDHSDDDESVIILDEWPDKKAIQMRGEKTIQRTSSLDEWPDQKVELMTGEKPIQRTSSLNWPKKTRAQEVARNFISFNPFFTVFIKPVHVASYRLPIPDLEDIVENKEKYVTLQHGEKSWNVMYLPSHKNCSSHLSAGWSLFAGESELQPGDVCVFELISREDSVFKVHVFKSHG